MRSLGARLALWYAVISTATMILLFSIGRYSLEHYAIHGLDMLLQDEFTQIKRFLGPDYDNLTAEQMQNRMRGSGAYDYESVLFYYQIRLPSKGVEFNSSNLKGRKIAHSNTDQFYNIHFDGVQQEMRVAEYQLGSYQITIITSKAQIKSLMVGYTNIFISLTILVLLVNTGIGYFLSKIILKPIRTIQETATHISSDNLTERIPVSDVRDEISDLSRLLNLTFDRLESSFNQIRRFTAEASHELKTPLSLIRLQAEKLLTEGGLTASHSESLGIQLEEISRLNQIIEELLFLSRAEARAITLSNKQVDPTSYIKNFETDARVLCENKNIIFQCITCGEGIVDFDTKWMRQVLLNLVSNAINVSNAGQTITLVSNVTSKHWKVHVEDQGPGVPNEQLERIFERFVRLDVQSNEPQLSGSGLGLAISRSIIKLHKGRIWAELIENKSGLRVIFEIPYNQSSLMEIAVSK
jgi:two-component system heavy metal sensor histidine kinase CusS